MIKFLSSISLLLTISILHASPYNLGLWSDSYDQLLLQKAGEETSILATYPSLQYPNAGFEKIPDKFPNQKVLIFGYGSLMNRMSASRSLDADTVATIKPAIAFGVKRVFNYKATKTDHWGQDQHPLEKAMLNLIPMTTYHSIANGVTVEVTPADFSRLIQRETGYDLMPILVADWENVSQEDPNVQIKIAYAFIVPDELRGGIDYTQTKYYPVRGYMHAAQEGAEEYGKHYLDLWNHTTYLANGQTKVSQWDEIDFGSLLNSREP